MKHYGTGGQARRRRFAVTVDGVRHEVIVEELEPAAYDHGADTAATGSTGLSSTISGGASASPPTPSPSTTSDSSGENPPVDGWIDAPMPGTVTEIAVQVGSRVQAGDVLLILTAMKLENEITSPAAGTVQAIAVAQGDNVNNGDRLVQLETGGKDR